MNQQERDDLRAHWDSGQQHRTHFLDCYKWHPECAVIRVLDAWEAEVHDGSEVSTTREVCDHWVGVKGSGHYRYGSTTPPAYWTHNYCPKCGEKL